MVQRLASRAQGVAIDFFQHLWFLVLPVLQFLGLFSLIGSVIVFLMLRYYDRVWLYTLGYPWTEWMRDHLPIFGLFLLVVSAAGAWWMWRSVTTALENILTREEFEATMPPIWREERLARRPYRWRALWALFPGAKTARRFRSAEIGRQLSGTMVKTFFLFGALGFITGHVIWGGGGVQQGHLAVGPGGQLYLTDPRGDSVIVSRPDGPQRLIGDAAGGVPGFHTPRGVVSDPSGHRLFVVDTYHQRVVLVDPENPGTNCSVLGNKGTGPGQFHEPTGIALEEWEGEGARNLYIFDGTRGKIIHFRLNGQQVEFVQEWGWKDSTPAPASPSSPISLGKCTEKQGVYREPGWPVASPAVAA